MLFLDFWKASDCVDHSILRKKHCHLFFIRFIITVIQRGKSHDCYFFSCGSRWYQMVHDLVVTFSMHVWWYLVYAAVKHVHVSLIWLIGSLSQTYLYITVDKACRWDCDAGGSFNWKIVKIVPTSQFHKKVRATRGLAPTSQLSWWWYIENERTKWERKGPIETPTLRGVFTKWLREKAWISSQLPNWKTPLVSSC